MSYLDDIQDYQRLAKRLERIDRSNAPSPTSPRALKKRIDHIETQNSDILDNLRKLEEQMNELKKLHSGQEDYLAIRKLVSSLKVTIDEKAEKNTLTELQAYTQSLPTLDKIIALGAGLLVLFIALLAIAAHYHLLQ